MPRINDKEIMVPAANYLLVTVGTTQFEHLITQLNSNPVPILDLCRTLHITEILLQIGSSKVEPIGLEEAAKNYQQPPPQQDNDSTTSRPAKTRSPSLPKITVNWVSYASNFQPYLQNASLVISHAGAGTILETLRSTTPDHTTAPKLFVVINDRLMDNHQEELAEAFASDNYLFYGGVGDFIEKLSNADWTKLIKYPAPNTTAMIGLIAQTVNVNLNHGAVVPIVQQQQQQQQQDVIKG